MGLTIKIVYEGLEEAIAHMEKIDTRIPANMERQMKEIASAGETAWHGVIPRGRTGQLSGQAKGEASGMVATFSDDTWYYGLVNDGHSTARGWRRPWGYQVAKRVSHVEGREMTKALAQWARNNAGEYLAKALKDL
jgi:hypothetical protein